MSSPDSKSIFVNTRYLQVHLPRLPSLLIRQHPDDCSQRLRIELSNLHTLPPQQTLPLKRQPQMRRKLAIRKPLAPRRDPTSRQEMETPQTLQLSNILQQPHHAPLDGPLRYRPAHVVRAHCYARQPQRLWYLVQEVLVQVGIAPKRNVSYIGGLPRIEAVAQPLQCGGCVGFEPVEAGEAVGVGEGLTVELAAREEHAECAAVGGVVLHGEAEELLPDVGGAVAGEDVVEDQISQFAG